MALGSSATSGTEAERSAALSIRPAAGVKRIKKAAPADTILTSADSKPAAGKTIAAKAAPKKSATRDSILRAAAHVFAKHGYNGGSVEKISRRAKSVDRMIYYYFGSKEGLFVAVLEQAYERMNAAEATLTLDLAAPTDSLIAVIRFMHGYYRRHPEFITLLNTENLHKGRHIAKSPHVQEYSSPAVSIIAQLLRSGAKLGVFRTDLAARDVYLLIVSTGYFYVSNRHTMSAFLGADLLESGAVEHWERCVIDSVLRTVKKA